MNYKVLVVLILLIFPMQVFAKEEIDIGCEKVNNYYECKISGNIDYFVSAIDFHFSLPTNAKVVSYEIDSIWEGSADNNWVSLYSAENHIGKISFLTLNVDAGDDFSKDDIKIQDLLIYDSKYQEHKISNEEIKKSEKNIKFYNNKLLIVVICVIIILGIIALVIKLKGDSK